MFTVFLLKRTKKYCRLWDSNSWPLVL